MKKLGIPAVLMLLFTVAAGAIDTGPRDHQITVQNVSKDPITVEILWSGGGVSPVDLAPGETHQDAVPSAIDSVKVRATGNCREAVQAFNMRRANRATINCENGSYTIRLEVTRPPR
jgi:hypothetical protein